jgi:hypothetical protein
MNVSTSEEDTFVKYMQSTGSRIAQLNWYTWMARICFLVRNRDFSLLHITQIGPGVYPDIG